MQVYLYAKSGHSIGLDATRRCSAIANELKDFDPILCTSDFRAGAYAKEELNVRRYVSVDVLSNLPNMLKRGDILIYDTDEASDFMENHMEDFCTLLYKVGSDIPTFTIDSTLYVPNTTPSLEKTFFFGDDDYKNGLLELLQNSEKNDIHLLLGHYFFLGNEKKLSKYFSSLIEEEEYVQTIKDSKYLLSGSLNACLESIACGNLPVLLKREDKEYDETIISTIGIPTIPMSSDIQDILSKFDNITQSYPEITPFEQLDFGKITNEINQKMELFKKLQQ